MRPATSQTPAVCAARRVLLAVTSAALAAGVMASTAGMATASITRPAASTAAPLSGAPVLRRDRGGKNEERRSVRDVVRIFSSATGAPAATLEVPGSQNLLR